MAAPHALQDRDGGTLPARPVKETGGCAQLESAHFVMRPGYHVYRRRGTPTALLFFTRAGQGFFRSSRGGLHVARAGELTVYEPSVEQEYGTLPGRGRPWDFHWVHFFGRAHWASWLTLPPVRAVPGLSTLEVGGPGRRAQLVGLFTGLHRDVRLGGPWRQELAMNALERLLLLAWDGLGGAARAPIDPRIHAALEAISRDPVTRYTVAGLARQARLSPSRFAHLFRAQTGLAVMDSVLRTRMKEAEKLLELTHTPICEIADRLGFSSPQHFSAQFTRRHGLGPRAFRRGVQRVAVPVPVAG